MEVMVMSKLTTQELMDEFNISRSTLQRLKKEGLPSEKVPGETAHKYDRETVAKWIEKRIEGIKSLKVGDVFDNATLASTFRCAISGGMRRSHTTNTLILISDHTKMFDDRWDGDTFLYTGMGQNGPQSLDYGQNKTVAESNENGIKMYLFEVFVPNQYTFIGEVKLASKPYTEQQPGNDNVMRQVWIFPLKVIGEKYNFPESVIRENSKEKEQKAKRKSDKELGELARLARGGKRTSTTVIYERDPHVSELAKRFAGGVCQLCDNPAPFEDKKGNPYLESHHIQWLSRDGRDDIENCIALCPSCHRRAHVLDLEEDINKLKVRAKELFEKNKHLLQ
jgi:5-methylcytosine-specific restriction enzyme A